MEKAKCIKCNEEKSILAFELRKGRDKRSLTCRTCLKGFKNSRLVDAEEDKELYKDCLKRCRKCREIKSLDSFHSDSIKQSGKSSYCKECKQKRYNSEYTRERGYILKYNLTRKEYDWMYFIRNGKCDICKKHTAKLDVDHCHSTGEVRGLLCGPCNRGLGQFKDDEKLLEKAVLYLKEATYKKMAEI